MAVRRRDRRCRTAKWLSALRKGVGPGVAEVVAADRIRELLNGLAEKLDPQGRVRDGALHACILRAHAGRGMVHDDVVFVALGRPATHANLTALRHICRERFGRELPPDYLAFLTTCDGLRVRTLTRQGADAAARAEPTPRAMSGFYEDAIMSSDVALDWMNAHVVDVAHADGSTARQVPCVVPIYDMLECGVHGLDFASGTPRVVDVEGGRLWKLDGHRVIAESFAAWLEAFVRSGFDPLVTAGKRPATLGSNQAWRTPVLLLVLLLLAAAVWRAGWR